MLDACRSLRCQFAISKVEASTVQPSLLGGLRLGLPVANQYDGFHPPKKKMKRGFSLSENGKYVESVWAALSSSRYPNEKTDTGIKYCWDFQQSTLEAMRRHMEERRTVSLFVSEGKEMQDKGPHYVVSEDKVSRGGRQYLRFELSNSEEPEEPVRKRACNVVHYYGSGSHNRVPYDSMCEARRAFLFDLLNIKFVAHPKPSVTVDMPGRHTYEPDFLVLI